MRRSCINILIELAIHHSHRHRNKMTKQMESIEIVQCHVLIHISHPSNSINKLIFQQIFCISSVSHSVTCTFKTEHCKNSLIKKNNSNWPIFLGLFEIGPFWMCPLLDEKHSALPAMWGPKQPNYFFSVNICSDCSVHEWMSYLIWKSIKKHNHKKGASKSIIF